MFPPIVEVVDYQSVGSEVLAAAADVIVIGGLMIGFALIWTLIRFSRAIVDQEVVRPRQFLRVKERR